MELAGCIAVVTGGGSGIMVVDPKALLQPKA